MRKNDPTPTPNPSPEGERSSPPCELSLAVLYLAELMLRLDWATILASEAMEKQDTSMNLDLQTVSSEDGDDPASRRWLAGERVINSHNLFLYPRKAS